MTSITDNAAPAQHANRDEAVAFLVMAVVLAAVPFIGIYPLFRDAGAVLRAVRLRLQPADRLWRAAVVRSCDVSRHGRLCHRARAEGLGLSPELGILAGIAAAAALGVIAGLVAIRRQGIYFAMITLALAQMVYFIYLQAPFTHGEDGIQGVPRGRLFGFLNCPTRPRSITWCWRSSCWRSC